MMKKVVVFTPFEILEQECYDNTLHDNILEGMFEDNLWEVYHKQMDQNDIEFSQMYKSLLHTRAQYLAFSIGFSVLYETDYYHVFYIGDYVDEKMIDYVSQFQNKDDYLAFVTILNKADSDSFYKKETTENTSYDEVYQELMNLLYEKYELQNDVGKRAK